MYAGAVDRNRRTHMSPLKSSLLSLVLPAALALGIFWLIGGSFETLQNGKWADPDDHPTNYLDTDLHPDW
jgi:hypothetical protein